MRRGKEKLNKGVERLTLESRALGAQFEMFLPEGWRVTKARPKARRKSSSRRKPARKSRVR
jgi:hypothetical protein